MGIMPKSSDKENERLSNLYMLWDSHERYLATKGFSTAVTQWRNFYEGKQWVLNDFTRTLPLVTINIQRMIVNNKLAQILQSKKKINVSTSNDTSLGETLSNFLQYSDKKMNMEEIYRRYAKSTLRDGTGVIYYYIEDSPKNEGTRFSGQLQAETLDMLDVAFANPNGHDVQKQEWIMFRKRATVKEVISIADRKLDINDVCPENDNLDETETDDNKKLWLYTRLFRINGEVYFERATKTIMLHKPMPMNPNLTELMLKQKSNEKYIDDSNANIDNEVYEGVDKGKEAIQETDVKETDYDFSSYTGDKFDLYPIDLLTFEERNKCIYGIGDVEATMQNQVAINKYYTMAVKTVLDNGSPKWVVREDALEGQEITNDPSQVLVNHSIHEDGIRQVQGMQFANGSTVLPQEIFSLTRSFTHCSEATSGELSTSSDSGYMVSQLIAQASKPTQQLEKAFMRSLERMAKIKLQFFKFYYDETPFTYDLDGYEYDKEVEENGEDRAIKSPQELFVPTDLNGAEFDIQIEAGQGTEYSEVATMQFAQTFLLNGTIDKLDPDTLDVAIQLMPKGVLGDKYPVIKKMIRDKKEGVIAQLNAQIEALNGQVQQLASECKDYSDALDSADKVNQQLQKEFTTKLEIYEALLKNKDTKGNDTTK